MKGESTKFLKVGLQTTTKFGNIEMRHEDRETEIEPERERKRGRDRDRQRQRENLHIPCMCHQVVVLLRWQTIQTGNI
jgi:hypothetical protein